MEDSIFNKMRMAVKVLGDTIEELAKQSTMNAALNPSPIIVPANARLLTEAKSADPSITIPKGRPICWGQQVSDEFIESVLWIEAQLGLDINNMMACMKFESNLNPKAKNPASTATGLIQFMEFTAKTLGTTTAALSQMPHVQQLSYVYKYFKQYQDRGHKLESWSLEDTYMSILWPAGIGKNPDYKVFVNDPVKARDAYDVNRGLDANQDGIVSKTEACAKVVKLAKEGLAPGNVRYY